MVAATAVAIKLPRTFFPSLLSAFRSVGAAFGVTACKNLISLCVNILRIAESSMGEPSFLVFFVNHVAAGLCDVRLATIRCDAGVGSLAETSHIEAVLSNLCATLA